MFRIIILFLVLSLWSVSATTAQTETITLCGKCKTTKQRGKKRNFKNIKQLFQHLEFQPITSTKLNPSLVQILGLRNILPANQDLFFSSVVMDRAGEFWTNGVGMTSGNSLRLNLVENDENMEVHSYYFYIESTSMASLITYFPEEQSAMIQVLN